ncbi:response regulator transcription factor [Cryptosporangium minutisporangium]|uniref:Response regulatory domain-containing protein n=1 Tax=Cryptosporangium minutisporangium TaxID=113569 RepID=A0ABP6SSB2_9ACTN
MATVLVAENEPQIAFGLNLIYTRAGYRTHLVTTGPETLECIRSAPPDVLVMNPHLPDVDGLDICRHLKAGPETADLPILLISARYTHAEAAAARASGADDYIAKPFKNAELLDRTETLLRRRPGHASSRSEPPIGVEVQWRP